MNAADFNRLVEHPASLHDTSAADLRELAARFPFCASLHLMLIKKYQLEKHPEFDSRLAFTAAYANDRKALYRLLYDEAKFARLPEEAAAVASHEQRVGTEIMLGNESGAFSDYTPKNQVAEIETFESMEYDSVGEVEGLLQMERENSEQVSFELQEQFVLANQAAGGGAEVSADFQDLEEDRDDELLEEDVDAEIESIKALESAVAENDVQPVLAEPRKATNGIGRYEDATPNKPLEPAEPAVVELIEHPVESTPGEAVPEQQREMPADPLEHTNVETEESSSPKEEISSYLQRVDNEPTERPDELFAPSEDLAGLLSLYDDEADSTGLVEETVEEDTGHETSENAVAKNVIAGPHPEAEAARMPKDSGNDKTSGHDELADRTLDNEPSHEHISAAGPGNIPEEVLRDVIREDSLPTGIEEHAVDTELTNALSAQTQPAVEDISNETPEEIQQEVIGEAPAGFHHGEPVEEKPVIFDTIKEEITAETPEANNEAVQVSGSLHSNAQTHPTPELSSRYDGDGPIAEEDVVGETHKKIFDADAAPYRADDAPASADVKQSEATVPVDTQGQRSFLDWLRLFNQKHEVQTGAESTQPSASSAASTPAAKASQSAVSGDSSEASAPPASPSPQEKSHAGTHRQNPPESQAHTQTSTQPDELYDRAWQARQYEMESWTSGIPDELRVIDEFVAQTQPPKPNPKPDVSVAELAQRSLEVKEDFVTETMARVYAAQGKYKRAAEIIEKLMLKYPAKSRYFADLLEEIKKKIN